MKKIFAFLMTFALLFLVGVQNANAASYHGHVYCKNSQNAKRVALTFDDGPHPRYTEQILKILEEYGVTATFFVIGVNVENYPDSLDKIVESGCEIGNHTYSHVRIDKMSEEEL